MGQLIFDDWALREENAFRSRRTAYIVVMSILLVGLALVFVLTLIYWYPLLYFVILLFSLGCVLLEWLKVKNHHLRIYENAIHITDRFGREKTYSVDYQACTLVLKKSVQRGGGIWLRFFDCNKKLICAYEDMLNHATYYGGTPTAWEQAVMELKMQIIDENYILKNR